MSTAAMLPPEEVEDLSEDAQLRKQIEDNTNESTLTVENDVKLVCLYGRQSTLTVENDVKLVCLYGRQSTLTVENDVKLVCLVDEEEDVKLVCCYGQGLAQRPTTDTNFRLVDSVT
ncbi:hypothetical protein BgiMline_008818 [Biomphalaria glabrata]|nr:hypothetical protein BgiMline_027395 [Biomphalaria glabrata]